MLREMHSQLRCQEMSISLLTLSRKEMPPNDCLCLRSKCELPACLCSQSAAARLSWRTRPLVPAPPWTARAGKCRQGAAGNRSFTFFYENPHRGCLLPLALNPRSGSTRRVLSKIPRILRGSKLLASQLRRFRCEPIIQHYSLARL